MRVLILLLTLLFSACATLPGPGERPRVNMELSELSSDKWLLTARFETPQTHLIFASSDGDFRKDTWSLLSPGRMKSALGIDSLHFDVPVTEARFEITPVAGRIRMSRYPFFRFSDGGTLILTKQFYMVPAFSEDEVDKLGGDLTKWRGYKLDHTLKLTTPQLTYLNGQLQPADAGPAVLEQDSRIIYVGRSPLKDFTNFRGTIDPNLPQWISAGVDENVGSIIDALEKLSGKTLPKTPELFFMGDPESDKYFAYSGVAFPGQTLALKVEGEALRTETRKIFHEVMYFYAHEISHLFQHILDVGRTTERAAWISEGSANLMGYRTVARAGLTNTEFTNREMRNAYGSCRDIMSGSVALGRTSIQSRYYDCGLMVSLITEAALPDDDIFSFWNALADKAKGNDGIYDGDLYFKLMRDRGAKASVVDALQDLVSTHIESHSLLDGPDKSVDLDTLLSNVGLSPRFTSGGALIDLAWD